MSELSFHSSRVTHDYSDTPAELGPVTIDIRHPEKLVATKGVKLSEFGMDIITTGAGTAEHIVVAEVDPRTGLPADKVALVRIPGAGIKKLEE